MSFGSLYISSNLSVLCVSSLSVSGERHLHSSMATTCAVIAWNLAIRLRNQEGKNSNL